ncbi:MAG: peptidoglycan DD-metalloendopeptidase family protein [Candidatus Nanopelagicales bacterium]
MPMGSTPDMLVVVDSDPASSAGLDIARRYARGALALTSWDAAEPRADVVAQASATSRPTIAEALRVAAQRRISWVGIRRDYAEPQKLLGELLKGTARSISGDLPGFAVFLADGQPAPFRRILAIVDRRQGPISGLAAHAAVAVADTTGAVLDVLVLGAQGEQLTSEDQDELLAISREQELWQRAVARARAADFTTNWIPAVGVDDAWPVIADQLSQHDYDLVIDDLGDVSLGGRLRTNRSLADTLSRGEVGEIPLRLLTEVPIPILLVIDQIRLGMRSATLLKASAAAAISLGVVSASVVPPGAAAATYSAAANPAEDLVRELEGALGITDSAVQARTQAAESVSRGEASTGARGTAQAQAPAQSFAPTAATPSPVAPTGGAPTAVGPQSSSTAAPAAPTQTDTKATTTKAAKPKAATTKAAEPKAPTAPKGGATPKDVEKAASAAAAEKAALAKEKALADKAERASAKAEEALGTTQEAAEVAVSELRAATMSLDEALAHAEQTQAESTGVQSLLPGGATAEQAEFAALAALSAQKRLDDAVERGASVLDDLSAAEQALEDKAEVLAERTSEVTQTKADYQQSKDKAQVYRASLATTRQAPVKKGQYNLTAHFGDTGGRWSSGMHTGLDFAAPSGTDVLAAASGTVVSTGYAGAYGNQIIIDHGGGWQTTYNHLSSIRTAKGQKVSTGDHIGDVGSTGNSTGSHLHFEVTKNDKFVDPSAWLGW